MREVAPTFSKAKMMANGWTHAETHALLGVWGRPTSRHSYVVSRNKVIFEQIAAICKLFILQFAQRKPWYKLVIIHATSPLLSHK